MLIPVIIKKNLKRLICCLALMSSLIFGQEKQNNVFDSIVCEEKQQLIARLELLIKYQIEQQWNKQYDLLSITYIQNTSKTEYIDIKQKELSKLQLMQFIPTHVMFISSQINNQELVIYGCGSFRSKENVQHLESEIFAYQENMTWHFSPVSITLQLDSKGIPCKESGYLHKK